MNQVMVSSIKPELPEKWQEILSDVITDPKELLRILELNNEDCAAIEEIILSRGDPLPASDRQLNWLIDQLGTSYHLSTLQIRTQIPIVVPQRLTQELVDILRNSALIIVVVLRCPHPHEMGCRLSEKSENRIENGVTLLYKKEIFNDINDISRILEELSKPLLAARILTHYLLLPDKVAGISHYAAGSAQAMSVMVEMQTELPGYLTPNLVMEEPGSAFQAQLL
jgi:KamA family protein